MGRHSSAGVAHHARTTDVSELLARRQNGVASVSPEASRRSGQGVKFGPLSVVTSHRGASVPRAHAMGSLHHSPMRAPAARDQPLSSVGGGSTVYSPAYPMDVTDPFFDESGGETRCTLLGPGSPSLRAALQRRNSKVSMQLSKSFSFAMGGHRPHDGVLLPLSPVARSSKKAVGSSVVAPCSGGCLDEGVDCSDEDVLRAKARNLRDWSRDVCKSRPVQGAARTGLERELCRRRLRLAEKIVAGSSKPIASTSPPHIAALHARIACYDDTAIPIRTEARNVNDDGSGVGATPSEACD